MDRLVRLIDVGARGGIDNRWKPFHDRLEVLAFEPDPDECARLNAGTYPYSIQFVPAALGARDGQEACLRMCREPGCSSLFDPNPDFCRLYPWGDEMQVVCELPMTLSRMDTVCDGFRPNAIKIDTQGYELEILKGAGDMLDGVLAVELEVEFAPQYRDQPLFADLDGFMRRMGFSLRGLMRSYWRTKAQQAHPAGGQLVHGDALYLRPERMDCDAGHIILAAYRQYDLLAHFGAGHLIPRRPLLPRVAARILSRFDNLELRRFVDSLRPATATDWHDPDFF